MDERQSEQANTKQGLREEVIMGDCCPDVFRGWKDEKGLIGSLGSIMGLSSASRDLTPTSPRKL
jgi:hypothetical protein